MVCGRTAVGQRPASPAALNAALSITAALSSSYAA